MKLLDSVNKRMKSYLEGYKPYFRVLKYCRPYMSRIVPAFICAWVSSALEATPLLGVKFVIDRVLAEKNFTLMYLITGGILLITVFKVALAYVNTYLMTWVGNKVIIDIRMQLYDKTQRLSFRVLYRKRIGEFISRITNDVTMLQSILVQVAMDLFIRCANVAAILIAMIYLNWKLTIIAGMIIPVAVFAMNRVGKRLRSIGSSIQEQVAQLSAVAIETLSAIRIVRAFATESAEYAQFDAKNKEFFRVTIKGSQTRGMLDGIMEVVQYVALVIVLMVGAYFVTASDPTSNGFTTGDLMSFCLAIGTLARPVQMITRTLAQLRGGIAAADRVFEIIDQPDEVPLPERPVVLDHMRGEITFEDVSFEYEKEIKVLNGLNLRIEPGERVAIVGVTGAGKSTIVDLILRFYDPTGGRILIDGVDLRDIDIYDYRRKIGFVPQDPVLMKGTLASNISYGLENCTEDEIDAAARTAGIADFIMSLPKKYESEVGERGVTLSGGQRQRVAIARAIVRNPAILLMDEATSSLDSLVESQIQGAMNEAMKGRTSIVIAHRLSTIRESDRILVISNGEIVEEGSHEELLKLHGHYYNLHLLQAGSKVA
ncbi:MAG: ABC transporter ATP-binding protein/permease [Synergistaceae bacterium]|nr:ABC transporter ATP-binding protein/permease [Synergistaceae bacterium]